MLKRISAVLLCASGLFTTQVFSAPTQNQVMPQASSFDYELLPHAPQVFSNILMWKITFNCKVISDLPTNAINIAVLKYSGSINGMPLSAGQSLVWVAHPGDFVHIVAEMGGKVELTNLENQTIRASCSPA
jgi:hypothetical protein